MTQEERNLLIQDICARLPYGVKVQYDNGIYNIDYISALYEEIKLDIPDNYTIGISEIKPYLRPLSTITKDELKYFLSLSRQGCSIATMVAKINYLNKKMFDFRGLIPRGRAIEVTEDNNPYK